MTEKIEQLVEVNGEWSQWIYPDMKKFREYCCFCGLAHDVQYRIDEKGVSFRVKQNARATAAVRRKKK